MTYAPRAYDEIVRDLLTTLTGGTVRESFLMPPGDGPIRLNNRPVRRVSHLRGLVAASAAPDAPEIDFRFTPADYELISTTGDDANRDAIRFREDGRRPIVGTSVVVNYYPIQTPPVPLTDLNVGSVTRTIVETIARELAMVYHDLGFVYDSAFIDTAEGGSLDRVVALVGVRRLPAGNPVARIRFGRVAGTAGRITVPTGTPITTRAGDRYLTSEPVTLEPGELSRDANAVGEGTATAVVDAATLILLEVAIAGIGSVTNPQPARRLSAPETDDDLRRRARAALAGVARGTVDALEFGLKSITGVKDAVVTEFPNGVAGELRLEIAYEDDSPDVRAEVARRIQDLRPAGVRVIPSDAARLAVDVQVALTLAEAGLPAAQVTSLQAAVGAAVEGQLRGLAPGGRVRRAQLTSLVLRDPRIVDARVTLTPEHGAPVEELQLESGSVLDVRSVTFLPPSAERASSVSLTSQVSASIPIRLLAGVTLADATSAIGLALAGHLAGRNPSAALTVDGLLAAIRDDTRFAAIRAEVVVTVESGSAFMQLTDGLGSYSPALNETLAVGALDLQPREGV